MPFTGGRKWAVVYALTGVVLVLLSVLHPVVLEPGAPLLYQICYALFSLVTSAAILYGAYRHYRNPFPAHRYWRINIWMFFGGFFITAVGLVSLHAGSRTVRTGELLESAQMMVSVGLATGFLVGSFEARSLENAADAARTQTLENQRERLQLLTDLLQHYVLNGATVIGGHAQNLESSTSGELTESAQIIRERVSAMANLVNNIGALTRTDWGPTEVIEADIEESLRENFRAICEEETRLKISDEIPLMYANLGYENAVPLFMEGIRETLKSGGTITVDAHTNRDIISIVAHPVEVPEGLRDELLEPVATDIGLEMFLARKVLEPAIEFDVRTGDNNELEITLRGEFVEK